MPERLTFGGIVSGVGATETPCFRQRMSKTDAEYVAGRLANAELTVAAAAAEGDAATISSRHS